MPMKNKFILPLLLALFTAGIISLILIQEPFRNDTQKYLELKSSTKSTIVTGNNEAATKEALKTAFVNFESIKCSKVDAEFRVECDRLRQALRDIQPYITNPDKSNTLEAQQLATEIIRILK
jgi:hypothetical protein